MSQQPANSDPSADSAPDPILRELEHVDAEAFAPIEEHLTGLETRTLSELDEFFDRHERQAEDVLKRLSRAKAESERSMEDFRSRFLERPLDDDEFRARMVMLDMEYGSRVRLAEEGLKLMRQSIEGHFETERAWARGLCDEVRKILRTRIELARARLVEFFARRDQLIRETRQQLDCVRKELDDRKNEAGEREQAHRRELRGSRQSFEALEREKERSLEEARAKARQLETRLATLEGMERRVQESERAVSRLEAVLKKERARHLGERTLQQKAIEELRGKAAELESLRGKLQEAEAALEAVRRETAGAEAERGDRAETLSAELDTLRGKLRGSEQALAEALKGAAQARSLREKLDNAEAALRSSLSEARQAAELRKHLAAADAGLKKAEDAARSLRERVEEAEKRAAETRLTPIDSSAKKVVFGGDVPEPDSKLREVQAERDDALARVAEAEEAIGRRTRYLEQLQERLKKTEFDLEEARRPAGGSRETARAAASETPETETLRIELKEAESAREGAESARKNLLEHLQRAKGALEKVQHVSSEKKKAEAEALREAEEIKLLREKLAHTEAALEAASEQREAAPLPEALRREMGGKVAELEKANANLKTALKEALASGGEGGDEVGVPKLRAELESLRGRLKTAEGELKVARGCAEQSQQAFLRSQERLNNLQRELLAADVSRDRTKLRLSDSWKAEKEELEEQLIEKSRELETLKNVHDQCERSWEETQTRQDAMRMQEIFKLRAQLQELKSRSAESAQPDDPKTSESSS